jgi:hypothetical protein
VTKPDLVSLASPHIIFRFFETFCEDASQNKLRVSANFMILGAMVQTLWVFEVFGQALAKAGMCWSQPARVDHFYKKWRAREKKNSKKNGQYNTVHVSTRGRWATRGSPVTSGRRLQVVGQRLADDQLLPVGCGSTPRQCYTVEIFLFFETLFEACPYTWKCKILHFHGDWRFHFF